MSIDVHALPPTSKLNPSNLIKQIFKEEWGIITLHNFQLTAIEIIEFDKKAIIIVKGASRGKSIAPLGALAMLCGVALALVPLLSLGGD